MFINIFIKSIYLDESNCKDICSQNIRLLPFLSFSSLDLFHCPWANPLEWTIGLKDKAFSVPNKGVKTRSGVVGCNEG